MKFNSDMEPEDMDQLFAQQFRNIEVNPNEQSWNDIQESLDHQNIDLVFKNHFEQIECTPSPKVWEEVKTHLPLNLWVKTHLHWMSKVAATLVLGMLAFYLYTEPNASFSTIAESATLEKVSPPIDVLSIAESKEAFVFDIPQIETKEEASVSQVFSEEVAALEEAEDFLASLLLDEDEFTNSINEEKISEILKPIQQLPIENIAAMLIDKQESETKVSAVKSTKFDDNIELQITIPLKVVEDNEIEGLINYYDQQNSPKPE